MRWSGSLVFVSSATLPFSNKRLVCCVDRLNPQPAAEVHLVAESSEVLYAPSFRFDWCYAYMIVHWLMLVGLGLLLFVVSYSPKRMPIRVHITLIGTAVAVTGYSLVVSVAPGYQPFDVLTLRDYPQAGRAIVFS